MLVNPPTNMAAGSGKRGSRGDDDSDSTRLPSLWCAVVVVVVAAAMVMLSSVPGVQGAPTPTNDTMVVSKTLLAGQYWQGVEQEPRPMFW